MNFTEDVCLKQQTVKNTSPAQLPPAYSQHIDAASYLETNKASSSALPLQAGLWWTRTDHGHANDGGSRTKEREQGLRHDGMKL